MAAKRPKQKSEAKIFALREDDEGLEFDKDGKLIKEMPYEEPVVALAAHVTRVGDLVNGNEYLEKMKEIVREVARAGNWSKAVIRKDIHDETTTGLSEHSAERPTPKSEYRRRVRNHEHRRKRKPQEGGDDFYDPPPPGPSGNGSGNPPGNSGSGASGGRKGGGAGAKGGSGKGVGFANPFAALAEGGESDSHGNPVYYADITIAGKTSCHWVSVVAQGYPIQGRNCYCLYGGPSLTGLTNPPPVSKKDPNQSRAKRLYTLAKALCDGTVEPLQAAPQYDLPMHNSNPNSDYYSGGAGHSDSAYHYDVTGAAPRPESRGNTGIEGYGSYTARPQSRSGADPRGDHDSWAAVPRNFASTGTSEAESRPASRAGSVASNTVPSKPPKAGPPGTTAASSKLTAKKSSSKTEKPPASVPSAKGSKQNPLPSRKMSPEKSKAVYTVHGIDKGKPFIKGLDKKNQEKHINVQYSETKKQFYAKLDSERIWLTAAK